MVDDVSGRTHACLASARTDLQKIVSVKLFLHLNHLATYHYTRNTWSVIEPGNMRLIW